MLDTYQVLSLLFLFGGFIIALLTYIDKHTRKWTNILLIGIRSLNFVSHTTWIEIFIATYVKKCYTENSL